MIIALAAKAVFFSRGADLPLEALPFDEHEEAAGLFVADRNRQGAGRAGELLGFGIELELGIHGAKLNPGGGLCLIIYGGLMAL